MATTNPNVPASQETAATTATSPNATVMSNQPAQLPPGATATPSGTVPVNTTTGAPVNPQADSAKVKEISADVKGKDYFEQQEVFAKEFEENQGEDSARRAARIEREAEEKASKGDPTRDPAAKQKAMDLNTPSPAPKKA